MRFHKLLCAASLLLAPSTALAHPDPAQFAPTAFTQEPTLVDCTLEDGTQTRCYKFTSRYKPEGLGSVLIISLTLPLFLGVIYSSGILSAKHC